MTPVLAPTRGSTVVDRHLKAVNGYAMLAIGLALIALFAWLTPTSFDKDGYALPRIWLFLLAILIIVAALAKGLVILQPNESLVCSAVRKLCGH